MGMLQCVFQCVAAICNDTHGLRPSSRALIKQRRVYVCGAVCVAVCVAVSCSDTHESRPGGRVRVKLLAHACVCCSVSHNALQCVLQ